MQYRDVLEENDNNNPKNQNQKLFEENQSVLDKDSFCNISVPKIAVTERQKIPKYVEIKQHSSK